MTAEGLRDLLGRRPFAPFTLLLADGRRFDVHDPGSVVVAKTTATLGLPAHRGRAGPEELARICTVRLASVVGAAARLPPRGALTPLGAGGLAPAAAAGQPVDSPCGAGSQAG